MASLGNILRVIKSRIVKPTANTKNYANVTAFANKFPDAGQQTLVIASGSAANGGSLNRKAYLLSDDFSMNIIAQTTTSAVDGSATFYNIPPGKYKVMIDGDPIDSGSRKSYQSVIYDGITVTYPLYISKLLKLCTQSSAYSSTLTVTGGTAPYSNLTVSSGSLPTGLSASLSGSTITISGTPSASGASSFSLSVLDSNGNTATASYTLTVAGSSDWTPAQLFTVSGTYGFWYDLTDMTSCYQDIAGTVPVTDVGQAIARIKDKSGNNNYVSVAATAPLVQQPLYGNLLVANLQIDNKGYTCFNPNNNYIFSGTLNNYTGNFDGNTSKTFFAIADTSQNGSHWAASVGTYPLMLIHGNGGVGYVNGFGCYLTIGGQMGVMYGYLGNASGSPPYVTPGIAANVSKQYNINGFEYSKNSNTYSVYQNGNTLASGIASVNANVNSSNYTILAGPGTYPSFFMGRSYHAIYINRVLTSTERTNLTTFLAKYQATPIVTTPVITNQVPYVTTTGTTINTQYTVNGGTAPYTFSVASGSLPSGWSLSSSGLMTGSTSTAGVYNYTIGITDSSGKYGTTLSPQTSYVVNTIAYQPSATSLADWTNGTQFTPVNNPFLNYGSNYILAYNSNVLNMYMSQPTSTKYLITVQPDQAFEFWFGCNATGAGYAFRVSSTYAGSSTSIGVVNATAWGTSPPTWNKQLSNNLLISGEQPATIYIDYSTPTSTNIWLNGVQVVTGLSLPSNGTFIQCRHWPYNAVINAALGAGGTLFNLTCAT